MRILCLLVINIDYINANKKSITQLINYVQIFQFYLIVVLNNYLFSVFNIFYSI